MGFSLVSPFTSRFRVGNLLIPSRNPLSLVETLPKLGFALVFLAIFFIYPSMTTNLSHSNPISVVLNGNNYILWNHHMTILLKSHGLYSYVTGTTVAPTRTANESAIDYAKRVNEWDINNAKILGFINASTTAEINQQFLGYTTAKSLWDFLTKRYSATGLAHQYQLWVTFQTKR